LLDAVRVGDARATGQLFLRHRSYLKQLVSVRFDRDLRNRIDPSDVVQEAQAEAVRRIGDYLENPALPFRLWLRQIACDRIVMLRRKHRNSRKRSVSVELRLDDPSSQVLAEQLIDRSKTPEDSLLRNEFERRVWIAVSQLDSGDSEIILLRNFERLSNEECAQLLGIQPNTASKRYGRALLRLRAKLLAADIEELPS
jgi:RNA polymerase sigma-70 factor (ECF subfamily)